MNQPLKVGIIGDFDANLRSHIATNEALRHAATVLSVTVDCSWLPTQSLDDEGSEAMLKPFDALWCAPASPVHARIGWPSALRSCFCTGWPFIGT